MSDWIKTSDRLPEPGQKVDWITPRGITVYGGKFEPGVLPTGEWYFKDSRLSVYYTPERWRPAEEAE